MTIPMLFFFASPIGLGHATRDIAIADRLQGAKDLLFVSGEGASRLIERRGYNVLDAYRPEKFIVEQGQPQQSFRWLMNYCSYYRKCKAIAHDVLKEENNNRSSNLVVSDEDFATIAV